MYQTVLDFWFEEITPAQWWKKDPEFDQLIQARFSDIHHQANQGELHSWRATPQGRLAEIIVLDQFSRNIYRDTPKAFASDSLALILAQEAITAKADQALDQHMLSFLYMPFMHSESLEIHKVATSLFKTANLIDNYNFEIKHQVIIEKFGRYPHRNAILGRESTTQEIEFLKQPGSSF
jgi:uncharacterized protein (DUF924 family)